MAKTEEEKKAFAKKMAEAKANKAKQAELPAMPPKSKKVRKPRKPIEQGDYPPGFGAKERRMKMDKAIAGIGKSYPKMAHDQVRQYLMEVGAGRWLALANHAPAAKKRKRAAAK